MPYCITLRARSDTRIITGWYSGSDCRWSTDHKRRQVFDNKHRAKAIRQELRILCPRNAEVINIEDERDALKAGIKALCATIPRVMLNYPDHTPPGEDYRQLAHRLRELAQETHRPYARQELLRLSGIYDRRAEHLDRRSD
jgi:hypothetical protein